MPTTGSVKGRLPGSCNAAFACGTGHAVGRDPVAELALAANESFLSFRCRTTGRVRRRLREAPSVSSKPAHGRFDSGFAQIGRYSGKARAGFGQGAQVATTRLPQVPFALPSSRSA